MSPTTRINRDGKTLYRTFDDFMAELQRMVKIDRYGLHEARDLIVKKCGFSNYGELKAAHVHVAVWHENSPSPQDSRLPVPSDASCPFNLARQDKYARLLAQFDAGEI